MSVAPTIDAVVTLSEGERRRYACDNDLYRPHLVVGDPDRREAVFDKRGHATEDYLGIVFSGDGRELAPGRPHDVKLTLFYHPQVNYDALRPGATFTIREGGRIVGFGEVRAPSGPQTQADATDRPSAGS